ncbi:amino acid ABC transporter permease [Azospirillum sp. RWY-5-1]|uniref:Amino acid ABC transporter permease n=1 Tax=Azospirillum oleiclasticum TaxID=2735135 RepID=A0ABX2TMF7_9PROT|nr:amino acid ABC transporter permease [Azospirillum oleiclasticum]NYZ16511.1 amino acid ABC transporter permease [Azospirillum oleiclasticum]NYZ24020.1 amino acid ABC transporter permease [Azospirillum oleiclasticum]
MDITLQFGQITPHLPYLLGGAWLSLQIAFLAFCGGMMLGLLGATALSFGPRWLRALVGAYVGFFMNTPQLVQIYFIFFALPDAGLLMEPYEAVLLGMTLNAGAYLTEIQRAGFTSIHRTELEAAQTIGFSLMQSVRYVILPHIMKVLFPPLSNHYILMTLGTSMAAIFGVEELTGRALNLNSQTFRSIEVFSITAGLYIVITFIATTLLALVGRGFFRARMRIL